jgi:hypothetical protein
MRSFKVEFLTENNSKIISKLATPQIANYIEQVIILKHDINCTPTLTCNNLQLS